jgi:hypothetical protein
MAMRATRPQPTAVRSSAFATCGARRPDPLTDPVYSRERRRRYSWLYEDDDIWASL